MKLFHVYTIDYGLDFHCETNRFWLAKLYFCFYLFFSKLPLYLTYTPKDDIKAQLIARRYNLPGDVQCRPARRI